jgi:dTDP-4-dehydrorhamnose 3,5-epimerase
VRLVDLRDGSPTRLAVERVRIDAAEERIALAIPAGVAHGFYAETEVLLQYLVDAPYTGDDEFGLAWDDAGIDTGWPTADPILSERDQANPSLEDVLRDPPSFS